MLSVTEIKFSWNQVFVKTGFKVILNQYQLQASQNKYKNADYSVVLTAATLFFFCFFIFLMTKSVFQTILDYKKNAPTEKNRPLTNVVYLYINAFYTAYIVRLTSKQGDQKKKKGKLLLARRTQAKNQYPTPKTYT